MDEEKRDVPVEETAVLDENASSPKDVVGGGSIGTADEPDNSGSEDGAETVKKNGAGTKRAVIAAAVVLAVAVGGGAAYVNTMQAQQPASEQKERAVEEETDSSDDEAATVEVGIAETADAMDEGTSPTIVHFKGTSGDAEGIDFYHATAAKEAMLGTDSVELAEGSYVVEFLPTVNSDGSINEGTGDKPQDLTIDASDDMERVVAVDSETTAADKVTADQIAEVQEATAEAISKGDGTLTGDAGEKVAEKVAENAAKAPAADKEKVEEAKQEASDAAGKESSAKTDSKGATSQVSQKSDTGKTSGSSAAIVKKDNGSSSKGTSSSGSGGTSSQSGSSAKEEHTHIWVAVTHEEPVYETRTRTVTDQAAWTEWVTGKPYYVGSDGTVFYDKASLMAHRSEVLDDPDASFSYSIQYEKEQVNHPAVTHEESYRVQTGTKTVTDGYKCSGCGATK